MCYSGLAPKYEWWKAISRALATVVVCLVLRTAVHAQGGLSLPPYTPASRAVDSAEYAVLTDPVAAALSLPALSRVSLPVSWVELRLWIGFGISSPDYLLRLVSGSRGVTGEAILWWIHPGDFLKEFAEGGTSSFLQDFAGRNGCVDSVAAGFPPEVQMRAGACVGDFGESAPDWHALYDTIVEMKALELPDPSTLRPPPVLVLDGWSMIVETLEGSKYRAYEYSNPDAQPWPEARLASAIANAARAILPGK